MSKAEDKLTPERWEKARKVLFGDNPDCVSERAAAKAAGLNVTGLRAWVKRSREQRPEDEPWVYEIAPAYDACVTEQGGVLEDKLWEYANKGMPEQKMVQGEWVETRKPAPHVGLKLLQARDDRYQPKSKLDVSVHMEEEVLLQKFIATMRLRAIAKETSDKDQEVPEIEHQERDETLLPDLSRAADGAEVL